VFIYGLKEGAGKNIGALIAHLIAIPLAGIVYLRLASIFSFLSGNNWDNFAGFFVAKYSIILILYLVFIFLSKRFIKKIQKKGPFIRLTGGVLSALNSSIGMVTVFLVVQAYPMSGWFGRQILGSSVLEWLATNLSFVKAMLPFT
jgi:hypothetical protein